MSQCGQHACILVVARRAGGVIGEEALLDEAQEEEDLSPSSSRHLGSRKISEVPAHSKCLAQIRIMSFVCFNLW